MDVYRPTGASDEKLDWHLAAMGRELIPPLAAVHPIDIAPAIKLRTSLPQAKQRRFAGVKTESAGFRIEGQLLHCALHANGQRVGGDVEGEFTALDGSWVGQRAQTRCRLTPILFDECSVNRNRLRTAIFQRLDCDAYGLPANWRECDLNRLAGDTDWVFLREGGSSHCGAAGGCNISQQPSASDWPGHVSRFLCMVSQSQMGDSPRVSHSSCLSQPISFQAC